MSKLKYYYITLLFGFLSFALIYAACLEPESTSTKSRFVNLKNGPSVTFIMGMDKQGSNYYSLATEHFLYNQNEKTDFVINSCKTISDIITFLNESKLRNDNTWSIINIVAHGNPNTGINLYLSEEGNKATPKRMLQAVLLDSLPKVKNHVVNNKTKLNVWSCGIGKNPLITISLKKIFQPNNGDSLSVYCSPHFVIFKADTATSEIRRLSLSYWPYYYKRGYRPSESEIAFEMSQLYPKDSLNWKIAIQEKEAKDLFSEEYHIPVSYTRVYTNKSDRPELISKEQQMEWIKSQSSIMGQIDDSGIPIHKFSWQVRKIIHTDQKGNKVPAIKAIGMATVMNVLQKIDA